MGHRDRYVDSLILPRPLQKQYLFSAHEEGIGPRILSRLTGNELMDYQVWVGTMLVETVENNPEGVKSIIKNEINR